jgi:O-6-methylguanine DNA methyltransferase
MTSKPKVCVAIEPDLIAAATGEAGPAAAERVQHHVSSCRPCREDYTRYHAIEGTVGELRSAPPPAADMGRTEHGVSVVEYLDREDAAVSRKLAQAGLETRRAETELEPFHRELLEFLAGHRTRLDWPLDMRLARSDFERQVLEATAAVPYGAVSSYTGIAADIGKPGSVRAVAQALRHNPVPIVVPCHRIVGLHGDLVGYAGNRTSLKERLLTLEGVPTDAARIARAAMYHYDPNPDRQYCVPTCGDIARRPLGTVRLFARRELAEATGLSPCVDCRPDLHPLPH